MLTRKEGADIWIVGVDYHPSVQQIAFVNTDTGECGERRLNHSEGEAEKFYRELKAVGCRVRVGIEATGHARWFERLLAELGFELWIGDPAKIKAKRVRKQNTDRLDAELLLQLLLEDRFPRVWVPIPAQSPQSEINVNVSYLLIALRISIWSSSVSFCSGKIEYVELGHEFISSAIHRVKVLRMCGFWF
jgi:hypothetical protein